MGDPLKPAKAGLGLEVWANGSPAELDLLRRHLDAMGAIVVPVDSKGRPDPTVPAPMGGADRGRSRVYWRVRVRGAR